MAVNYTNLFADMGVFIKTINQFQNSATGLPASLSGEITGATQGNPCVVGSTAHGLKTGDRIRIDGVEGMTELNDIDYTITVVDVDNFQLGGIDATGFGTWTANGVWTRYAPRPDLPELLDSIESSLNGTSRHDLLDGVPSLFDGFKDAVIAWSDALAGKVDERLIHRVTVLSELPGVGNSTALQDVLVELYRDMIDQAQSIKLNTVTLGSATADSGNTGNGTVMNDKVLDGVSVPFDGGFANLEWKGTNSELCVASETMTLTCISDEDTDGLPAGEEIFLWEGEAQPDTPLGWKTEGSGVSLSIPTLNAHNLISNRNFESWSANVPESWDLDNGTAGTHISQETLASNVYRGDSAAKFSGDGAEATIQISQTIPLRLLTPNRRYLLTCFVRGSAAIAAGTLTIQFESPSGGYTAGSTEKITMSSSDLSTQTTYGREEFYFTVPNKIPDDLELVVKITGTLTSAKDVWVDSLAFGPVEWGGGLNVAIVAGSIQFVRGDRFTFTVANDDIGAFQEYFRKRHRFQFPSNASPTITFVQEAASGTVSVPPPAATITTYLDDIFTTAEAAPLTSPRTCEPSDPTLTAPGEIIFTDTGNDFSISSSRLQLGQQGVWGDPAAHGRNTDDSGFPRQRCFHFTASPGTAQYCAWGWIIDETPAEADMKHAMYMLSDRTIRLRHTLDAAPTGEFAGIFWDNEALDFKIFTRKDGGALWMVKGGYFGSDYRPLGFSITGTDVTLYNAVMSQTMSSGYTDTWKVDDEVPPTLYMSYFNGNVSTSQYDIGLAISNSLAQTGRLVENPCLPKGAVSAWDETHVKDPFPLKDGNDVKIWYHGLGAGGAKIGLATSPDGISNFVRSGANPLLSGSGWSSGGVQFPYVYKDADSVPARRYRMLFSGFDGSGNAAIGRAYSPDGVGWTENGSNPVIPRGSAGEFDASILLSGALIKVAGTYYFFYGGRNSTGFPHDDSVGLVTFTDWDGTFTKHASSPVLLRRTGDQALTANMALGSDTVKVGDSTVFDLNEVVVLLSAAGPNVAEQVKIQSKPDNETIIVSRTARQAFNTADNARIQTILRSVDPMDIWLDGGTYRMLATAFQSGISQSILEMMYLLKCPAATFPLGWEYDHENSPGHWLPSLGAALGWDARSSENLRFLRDADTHERVTMSLV